MIGPVEKTVRHLNVFFDGATVRRGIEAMNYQIRVLRNIDVNDPDSVSFLDRATIEREAESWTFDSIDEFLADYGSARGTDAFRHASLTLSTDSGNIAFPPVYVRLTQWPDYASISVTAPTRQSIEAIQSVFTDAAPGLRIEPPVVEPIRPRIFVGHGGTSNAWNDLVAHLRDHHGLDVIAYETGSRSGHSIRDILDEMLQEATFAILVMTPEDEQADGVFRARQNVIHEAGLFQGKLGFPRAILVRQEGVEMLSNLDGIQYVGYTNSIRETYGEVLSAIRREFGAF